ncbi:MAG: ribonuclease, partial [Bacteroidota bacterium]
MEPTIIYIIIGIAALIIGAVLGKVLFAKNTKKQVADAEHQVQKIIADGQLQAENLKKEKLLEAKEKFVQLKAEHDKDVLQRNQKVIEGEGRIKQKEQSLNQKDQNLEKQIKENEAIKETLNRQIEVVNTKRTELEKHQEEHIRRLEKVAGLTAEDAKAQLIESLKQEAHTKAIAIQQEIIEDAKLKAN